MKTVLFVTLHEPTVHMCMNIHNTFDRENYRSVFVAYEKAAQKALEKRNIPYYNKKKKVKEILNEIKPDIVITPHNINPIAYLFVKNARKQHIPTLLMHEGGSEQSEFLEEKRVTNTGVTLLPLSVYDFTRLIMFIIGKKYSGNQYMAHSGSDVIAVISEKAEQFIKNTLGVKSKIVITGQPRFDDIINKTYNDKEIKEKYKVKDFVLILTSIVVVDGMWSKEKLEFFIRKITSMLKEMNKDFIIKIHPRESIDFYKRIDPELQVTNEDLYELIHASESIISIPSTTTLEALMFNKPVILPDFLTKGSYADELGIETGADSYDDIRIIIEHPKNVNNNIEKFVYKTDGKASQRVSKLIGDMI